MEKRKTSCTVRESVNWFSHYGKQYEVSQKIKNRTTIWSRDSTSGYLPKENKTLIGKDICTPMYIVALFTVAKILKQPKCLLVDKWIKKMWCIYIYTHTHNIILFSHKKILAFFTTWMDLEPYPKWDKSARRRQIMYDPNYMWIRKTNKQKYNRLIDTENKWVVARREEVGVGKTDKKD